MTLVRLAQPWGGFAAADVLDATPELAEELVQSGVAILVHVQQAEAAALQPAERAVKPDAKKRVR